MPAAKGVGACTELVVPTEIKLNRNVGLYFMELTNNYKFTRFCFFFLKLLYF